MRKRVGRPRKEKILEAEVGLKTSMMKFKTAAVLTSRTSNKSPKSKKSVLQVNAASRSTQAVAQEGTSSAARPIVVSKSNILNEIKAFRDTKDGSTGTIFTFPTKKITESNEQHSRIKPQDPAKQSAITISPTASPSTTAIPQIARPPSPSSLKGVSALQSHVLEKSFPLPKLATSFTPPQPSSTAASQFPVRQTLSSASVDASIESPFSVRLSPTKNLPNAGHGQTQQNYKAVARRVTLAIVAMPIAIVTSWVLYDRSM